MQQTSTQKVQTQKPWPRNMQTKSKSNASKNAKTCNFWKFFSPFFCCMFVAFSSSFCSFLNFWSSVRRPSQNCKTCTIPDFALLSRFFAFVFWIVFVFFSFLVCIFLEFFQFFELFEACVHALIFTSFFLFHLCLHFFALAFLLAFCLHCFLHFFCTCILWLLVFLHVFKLWIS